MADSPQYDGFHQFDIRLGHGEYRKLSEYGRRSIWSRLKEWYRSKSKAERKRIREKIAHARTGGEQAQSEWRGEIGVILAQAGISEAEFMLLIEDGLAETLRKGFVALTQSLLESFPEAAGHNVPANNQPDSTGRVNRTKALLIGGQLSSVKGDASPMPMGTSPLRISEAERITVDSSSWRDLQLRNEAQSDCAASEGEQSRAPSLDAIPEALVLAERMHQRTKRFAAKFGEFFDDWWDESVAARVFLKEAEFLARLLDRAKCAFLKAEPKLRRAADPGLGCAHWEAMVFAEQIRRRAFLLTAFAAGEELEVDFEELARRLRRWDEQMAEVPMPDIPRLINRMRDERIRSETDTPFAKEKRRGRQRGRKKLSDEDAKRRVALIERWNRAREADVKQEDFCENNGVTLDHLKRCLEWAATRTRRGQPYAPTNAVNRK